MLAKIRVRGPFNSPRRNVCDGAVSPSTLRDSAAGGRIDLDRGADEAFRCRNERYIYPLATGVFIQPVFHQ